MAPRTVGLALALVALWVSLAAADAIVYLSRDGVKLRPGKNNSYAQTSSLVDRTTTIRRWDASDELWAETVACVQEIYAPFAVTITEEPPGDVPYIHAVAGGSPEDLDLPRSYAGISPFSRDCDVIPRATVFAFTDILPPDARTVCNVLAQEIGHSFGLDHELLETSPMATGRGGTVRVFADQESSCGETSARPCGLPNATCRATQNSYALLAERIGLADGAEPPIAARGPGAESTADEIGCSAAGGRGSWVLLVLVAAAIATARRGNGSPTARRRPWAAARASRA